MGRKQGESGLRHLTDEQIVQGSKDKRLPKAERKRYVAEAKFRGLRNVRKRVRRFV